MLLFNPCPICGQIWVTCTFIILHPMLCGSIYRGYIVTERTLAGHKQFHWGLLCPPQYGWADTLSVTGHHNRTALLPYSQASAWPQNTKEEEMGHGKENKRHDWWHTLISLAATPEWLPDYLRLSVQLRSNCFFLCIPDGGHVPRLSLWDKFTTLLSVEQMCFCLQQSRGNYFCNVCLGFCIYPQCKKTTTCFIFCPSTSYMCPHHITTAIAASCPLKMEKNIQSSCNIDISIG